MQQANVSIRLLVQVNRLTRELSLLRAAHNASVVSNASSTSAASGANEQLAMPDTQHLVSGSGFSIPSSSDRRHHRTSSSASSRSLTAIGIAPTSVVGISGPAPVRPSSHAYTAAPLSRQNSTASRRSRAPSPAPYVPGAYAGSQPHSHTHASYPADPAAAGHSHPRAAPLTPGSGSASASQSELSPGLLPGTMRYEETAFYRSELEGVRRENDALKRRIRELERMVRERRASDAGASLSARPRSESASTSTSVGVSVAASGAGAAGGGGAAIMGPRERVVSALSTSGIPEDEVRVGESAASAGVCDREGVQASR